MRSLILLALPLLALSYGLERRQVISPPTGLTCEGSPTAGSCPIKTFCSGESGKVCFAGDYCCDCFNGALTLPADFMNPCPTGAKCTKNPGGSKNWFCHCDPKAGTVCKVGDVTPGKISKDCKCVADCMPTADCNDGKGNFDPTCKCVCNADAIAACPASKGSLDANCNCVCNAAAIAACPASRGDLDSGCNCVCKAAVITACPVSKGDLDSSCKCVCNAATIALCPASAGTLDADCNCVSTPPPPPTCTNCSHGAKCVDGKCKCLTTHYGIKKDSCKKGYHCVKSGGKQSCKKNPVKKQVSYSKNSGFNW